MGHKVEALEPRAATNAPGMATVHTELAQFCANVPDSQVEQFANAGTAAIDPGGQGNGAGEPATQNVPGAHAVWFATVDPLEQ